MPLQSRSASEIYDSLMAKYGDKPVKIKVEGEQLEDGWEICGAEADTVYVTKNVVGKGRITKKFPLNEFLSWQKL